MDDFIVVPQHSDHSNAILSSTYLRTLPLNSLPTSQNHSAIPSSTVTLLSPPASSRRAAQNLQRQCAVAPLAA